MRAVVGVFLLCAGAAFVVGIGVDALGVGTLPPSPSLGRLLGDSIALVLLSGPGPEPGSRGARPRLTCR